MDKEKRIAELEERKRQIDVEIAFYNGAKLKARNSFSDSKTWYDCENPSFAWDEYEYKIAEEPKRIPFDGSDGFNLINRRFKIKEYEDNFVVSIGVDEDGVYFHHDRVSYESLVDDYEIWNDILKVFEPCNKVA